MRDVAVKNYVEVFYGTEATLLLNPAGVVFLNALTFDSDVNFFLKFLVYDIPKIFSVAARLIFFFFFFLS